MQFMFVLVPIIVMISGLVGIFSPRTLWYMQEGWKYKNAEPSDAALVVYRIGGVVAIIGGIAFLIFSQSFFTGAGFP